MPARLSARQEQCVRLTAFRTDKEIAAHLGISEPTVKKHIHEACQRLGVNRRKAALAILEQNGPGYPNDPMAATTTLRPTAAFEGNGVDGDVRTAAAAMELGGAGGSAGPAERGEPEPPLARASVAPPEIGISHRLVGGSAGVPDERSHSGVPDPVVGYRAPPRGSLFRLTLIAVTAVVISAMLIAVGGLVSDFHHVVDRFDAKTP